MPLCFHLGNCQGHFEKGLGGRMSCLSLGVGGSSTGCQAGGTKGAPGHRAMSCGVLSQAGPGALGLSLRLTTPHREAVVTSCWWDRWGSSPRDVRTWGGGSLDPQTHPPPGRRRELRRTPHACVTISAFQMLRPLLSDLISQASWGRNGTEFCPLSTHGETEAPGSRGSPKAP